MEMAPWPRQGDVIFDVRPMETREKDSKRSGDVGRAPSSSSLLLLLLLLLLRASARFHQSGGGERGADLRQPVLGCETNANAPPIDGGLLETRRKGAPIRVT